VNCNTETLHYLINYMVDIYFIYLNKIAVPVQVDRLRVDWGSLSHRDERLTSIKHLTQGSISYVSTVPLYTKELRNADPHSAPYFSVSVYFAMGSANSTATATPGPGLTSSEKKVSQIHKT
jgi:hypothetical protein